MIYKKGGGKMPYIDPLDPNATGTFRSDHINDGEDDNLIGVNTENSNDDSSEAGEE